MLEISSRRGRALAACVGLVVACLIVRAAPAMALGKLQGRIVGTDTGEPVGFADILLIPADTTMRKVGGMSNADGTFLLEAAPGTYTFQIRAISYATQRFQGVAIKDGALLPMNVALTPDAIQQQEIVVEARARQNTESSMLAARKKAVAVGDAVSAEQVKRSPDKDAAEVLKRVTGLSVSDGKYVFVRGLGERYSSTEVDGVRIASPEQNKRVVPLDLLPSNLLENIVVQKTYTADRPGEFGGGDVQVHTKDFPGARVWSFSLSAGAVDGVTFHDHRSYAGSKSDFFGYGSDARGIPDAVDQLGGHQKLVSPQVPAATLAQIAQSFNPVWSSRFENTLPNSEYNASYGDELKLAGRSLGLIGSVNMAHRFDRRQEAQRLFRSGSGALFYDYDVDRSTESVQLGGIAGVSYRLSPSHAIHLRGLYTNDADDEVRVYEGPDYTRTESTYGGNLYHRSTRLLYIQRNVISGTVQGQHELPQFLETSLDWKFTRSQANRMQPDRREEIYDQRYYFEGDTAHWVIGSQGQREYGELEDNGWGTTINAAVPYALGGLGKGKVSVGYDRQTKARTNFYRRFNLIHTSDPNQWEMPPDTLFANDNLDHIEEYTFTDTRYTDNYNANQRFEAGYVNLDLPLGKRVRGNLGVRLENGLQDVQSYDLFNPEVILQEGKIKNSDWLPSANFTFGLSSIINLRAAASRTLSRPDLNELSPSPTQDYASGVLVLGNPHLKRALIDNYDVRFEAFPGLSEVFAAGAFYKNLHQPIEQVIQGSADPLLYPRNSNQGHNAGVELEARAGLEHLWGRFKGLLVNANASFISSEVEVSEADQNGSARHPLQGQANRLVNASLTYERGHGRIDGTILATYTGKRLHALGWAPLPDIYEQPFTTVDATLGCNPLPRTRLKLSATNLLDPLIRQLQGPYEVSAYHHGRGVKVALAYGS
jgi:outer membrane receptor protein involved in Fe transport